MPNPYLAALLAEHADRRAELDKQAVRKTTANRADKEAAASPRSADSTTASTKEN